MTPADVERIDVPVAAFIVPIVCEPVAEKFAPASAIRTAASACSTAWPKRSTPAASGRHAYSADSLRNPEILALARRVQYHVDPAFPGPGRFKGAVHVVLKDGRIFDEVEEYNRGSAENPMTYREIRGKFDENASAFLSQAARDRLADADRPGRTPPGCQRARRPRGGMTADCRPPTADCRLPTATATQNGRLPIQPPVSPPDLGTASRRVSS